MLLENGHSGIGTSRSASETLSVTVQQNDDAGEGLTNSSGFLVLGAVAIVWNRCTLDKLLARCQSDQVVHIP